MKNDSIPLSFKFGYRILMLMKRKKDGGTDNDRKSLRKISQNENNWDEIWNEFENIRKQDPTYRIYASVNSRNINKGIREFKTRQFLSDYESDEIRNKFYLDLHNRFLSCLGKPSCKMNSYFLIDCDTRDEYQLASRLIKKDDIIFQYPTRNGVHLITEPFNPTGFPVSIQKDGMMLVSE